VRGWLVHALFLMILVISIGADEQASDALDESADLAASVIGVARSHGLTYLPYTTASDPVPGLLFEEPGCSGRVRVFLLAVTFDAERIVRSTAKPGDQLRYVYIDRAWKRAERLAIVVTRAKYAVLGVLGLTRYEPSWHFLIVEAPDQCMANEIDWRSVWNRRNLRATENGPSTIME